MKSKLPHYMRDEEVTDAIEAMPFAEKRNAYLTWESRLIRGAESEGFREWLYRRTLDDLERRAERRNADFAVRPSLRIATPEQVRMLRGDA